MRFALLMAALLVPTWHDPNVAGVVKGTTDSGENVVLVVLNRPSPYVSLTKRDLDEMEKLVK